MNVGRELPDTPIKFSYELEDFVAASRLGAKLSRKWMISRSAIIVLIVVLLVAFDVDRTFLISYIVVVVFAVAAFLFAYQRWIIPRRAKKQFEQQPLAHLETIITILEDGVSMESERGEAHLLWEDFHGWRANDDTVLLYAAPNWYWVLPARLEAIGLPIGALRQLLESELGPAKS